MELEEKLQTVLLTDTYGGLLTKHQQRLMRLYYDDDLSLAEIAQQEGISRQAVRDCLVKAVAAMKQAEQELGIIKRENALRALAEELARQGRQDTANKINRILED